MSVASRILRTLRRRAGRLATRAARLTPASWTLRRLGPDRRLPPPSAFGRFGPTSRIAVPARIEGAARIEMGGAVNVFELSTMLVGRRGRLVLGDRASLGRLTSIRCASSIVIEPDVRTSDCVTIIDTWGDLDDGGAPPGGPVVIERGAYLGAGSVVCPGVRVGAGAFIGEGAVVVGAVPPGAVVSGNPATVVGRLEVPASGDPVQHQ